MTIPHPKSRILTTIFPFRFVVSGKKEDSRKLTPLAAQSVISSRTTRNDFRACKPTEIRKTGDGNGGCSTLEGISLAGISGGQTDDDGVENGSERRRTGRSSGEVGD